MTCRYPWTHHLRLELLHPRTCSSPQHHQPQEHSHLQVESKVPRRPSHLQGQGPLGAKGRHRQRGADRGAAEHPRRGQSQPPQRSQPAQRPRTLGMRAQCRHWTRQLHQRLQLPHLRHRQQPEQRTRSQSRTELRVRPRGLLKQLPNSMALSHRQARGPRAAMVRHRQRGAGHGAAEPRCSPRRQERTTGQKLIQTAVQQRHLSPRPNRMRRPLFQPLHRQRHRSRRLPHRHRVSRTHRLPPALRQRRPRRRSAVQPRRATRPQRAGRCRPARPRLRIRPSLPTQPPRRRNQRIPARPTQPRQRKCPARSARRWFPLGAMAHRPALWAGPSAANWNTWPYQDLFSFKVSIDCGTTLNRSPTTP